MSAIAEKVLEEHLSSGEPQEEEREGVDSSSSPSREALREAWEASKSGDFDSFADAIEALVDIKVAER